jgi:hypothetical protein
MVLTAAQTTAFFKNAAQIAIPNATVLQLVAEGINTVVNLSKFDKDTVQRRSTRTCPAFLPEGNILGTVKN